MLGQQAFAQHQINYIPKDIIGKLMRIYMNGCDGPNFGKKKPPEGGSSFWARLAPVRNCAMSDLACRLNRSTQRRREQTLGVLIRPRCQGLCGSQK
jgi:hypothetical protein